MTRTIRRPAAVLAAALAGLVALAPAAQAEELSFALFVGPTHTVFPSVVIPFQEAVARESGGTLTVRAYPGGELGAGAAEQYVRVVQGVADIAWGLAGNNSSQFPLSMIVELPGIVEAAGSGWEAMARAHDQYLAPEFIATRALALWTSEPSVLIMRDREVRHPDDLRGLRSRVSGSVPGQVIEALGATPVQMPASEMYNALQTGLVDGILTGGSAITDFRLSEVARSYTSGASFGNILFWVVMNEARFQGLSPEHRQAILAASGNWLSESGEAGWNAKADTTMEALRADPNEVVIDLTPEEAAAFNALTVPLTEAAVAALQAQGLPAAEVVALMTGR
jgi:TRAP-type C4-dicarboxylate transport system substrate-binding protein